jgi:hypothetical protein
VRRARSITTLGSHLVQHSIPPTHGATRARFAMAAVATAALLLSLLSLAGTVGAASPAANVASLNIKAVDGNNKPLAGAVFTVDGMSGTFTTGADGKACITGLPQDGHWLVTQVQAPVGYAIADPASQLAEVDDDGDCNSADAKFVNLPTSSSGSPSGSSSHSPEGSVKGGTGTPAASQSGEGSVKAGTGTPEASLANTATGTAPAGGSATAIAFAVLLVASLGGLAILNVAAVRRRR